MRTSLSDGGHFAAIIDSMTDMVRVLDQTGKIILTNAAFEDRFGDVIGTPCYKCWGQQSECEDCLRKTVERTNSEAFGERSILGRYYSVKAAPIFIGENIDGYVEVFRDVTDNIRVRNRLIDVNKKMKKELELARQLQNNMIQKEMPKTEGLKLSSCFLPCEAVGGDAYDCLDIGGGRLLIYVADVSGHGVRAAMLTVFVQQRMRMMAQKGLTDAAEYFEELQKAFREIGADPSVYITMFVVIIDRATGEYVCSNAGHSAVPLHRGKDGVSEIFLAGAPICTWKHCGGRETGSGKLLCGDRLLLYTDGLIDAGDPGASEKALFESFGSENFTPKALLEKIKRRRGKVGDDIAVLMAEKN